MDEARAVVADFCEKNPYLLGALPMTWFGCGPFARMVVAEIKVQAPHAIDAT